MVFKWQKCVLVSDKHLSEVVTYRKWKCERATIEGKMSKNNILEINVFIIIEIFDINISVMARYERKTKD
jgi:hypothetical protein